jgi:hypothetical protein
MISLTKTPRKISNTSWLCRPVNASEAGLNHYIDRQDLVAFWLAYSFAFDDTEPLPAMFRRKAPAADTAAPSATADYSNYTAAPSARLSLFRVSNMTASYIMAAVLFLFAAADAALLTIARFPPHEAAINLSASEIGVVETAVQSSPAVAAEELEVPAIEQAVNDRLLERREPSLSAGTAKPVKEADVCAVPSLNCWKSATFIR